MKQKSLTSFFNGGMVKPKDSDAGDIADADGESLEMDVDKKAAANVGGGSTARRKGRTVLSDDESTDMNNDEKDSANQPDGSDGDSIDLSDEENNRITVNDKKTPVSASKAIGTKRSSEMSDDVKKPVASKRQAALSEDDDDSTDLSSEEMEEPEEKVTKKTKKPAAKRTKKTNTKDSEASTLKKLEPIELLDTKEGKQVPFLALCKVFELVEATTKRLEITAYTREFLTQVMRIDEKQLAHAVMLCMAKIAPDHEGIELGIGESLLVKSIASATGRQTSRVKQDHHELGDLGVVAQRGKTTQKTMFKPKPLSISKVFASFKEIAMTSGSSSIQKKVSMITGLLASCSDIESRYLIRSLEGRLRIGLAESTVQTALAQAALVYEKGEAEEIAPEEFQRATEGLKQVMSEFPIYDSVIESIYKYGISDIGNHCMLTPTLPVKPMLAKIEKAADDILRRFEDKPFTCEFKYDGERSQIHYVRENDGSSKCVIFSRNAENNTGKYPDIANAVKEFAKDGVTSFILDCEAVAWDIGSGKIRSFQTLSSRKRKVENESEIVIGVCCFVFDILYLNGQVSDMGEITF
ncbi:ATP-dependent DNA ligase Cdc17 [Coemansia sp. RSA 1933]|nr:ATP-dependent DNA ligase Cdc17 [Coemansia sp. RSA 1933]